MFAIIGSDPYRTAATPFLRHNPAYGLFELALIIGAGIFFTILGKRKK
jgi:hypothetical protein